MPRLSHEMTAGNSISGQGIGAVATIERLITIAGGIERIDPVTAREGIIAVA